MKNNHIYEQLSILLMTVQHITTPRLELSEKYLKFQDVTHNQGYFQIN